VSIAAVQVAVSSGLTIFFRFASRDKTFAGNTFDVFFQKLSGLPFVFRFRVFGHVKKTMH